MTLLKKLFFITLLSVSNLNYAQTFEWAKSMGGTFYDEGMAITVDDSCNIYSTGTFYAPGNFDGTSIGISGQNSEVFVQKLDPNGNLIWAHSMGGTYQDVGVSITIDNAGNIYVIGTFRGNVDFDPDPNVTFNLNSGGSYDTFIQKLSPSGNLIWAKNYEASDPSTVRVDAADNVYILGNFSGNNVDFQPGAGSTNLSSTAYKFHISRFDSFGNFQWVRAPNGNGLARGRDLTIDFTGNLHVTGYFSSTVDFDLGPGTANASSGTSGDSFTAKYDNNGGYIWARTIGGNLNCEGNGIAVDNAGNVYTTGKFIGTVDFDPNAGTLILNAPVGNTYDVFVQQLDVNGNLINAKSFGSTGNDIGEDIVIDASGDVFIVGSFTGTVNFDPTGTTNLSSSGGTDIFVQKLDATLNILIDIDKMGGSGNDQVHEVHSSNSGSVVTTGFFVGNNADFGDLLSSFGYSDIYVHKYSDPMSAPIVTALQPTISLCCPSTPLVIGIENIATGNVYNTNNLFTPINNNPSSPQGGHFLNLPSCVTSTTQGNDIVYTFDPCQCSAGNYDIEYAYTDACGNTGSAIMTITVEQGPTVSYLPFAIDLCNYGGPIPIIPNTNGVSCQITGTFVNASGEFDAAMAGPGLHDIDITCQSANGCITTITETLQVIGLSVSILPQADLCANDAAVTLGGNPSNGTWSGPGVNSVGVFDPALVGPGTYTVNYDVNLGGSCSGVASTIITVNSLPNAYIFPISDVCESDGCFNILGVGYGNASITADVSPIGQTNVFWFFDYAQFCPNTAVPGVQNITLTTAPNQYGCVNSVEESFNVEPGPSITISGPTSICQSQTGLMSLCVSSSTPNLTYTWSNGGAGTCITFPSPSSTISFDVTATNSSGCSTTETHTITVLPPPLVTITHVAAFCANDAPISLIGNPIGGIWTGPGISSSGVLDPALAGVGNHTITYTYIDGSGCVGFDTELITVNPFPGAFMLPISDYCDDDPCFNAVGIGFGNGTFSADVSPIGATNTIFNFINIAQFCPDLATPGSQTITFTTAPNQYGCVNSVTEMFDVNSSSPITIAPITIDLCIVNSPVILTSPSGGTGCSVSGLYVNNGEFDAQASGVGNFDVTWTCGSGACTSTSIGAVTVEDNANWNQTTSNTSDEDKNNDVVTDAEGNVYTIGRISQSTRVGHIQFPIAASFNNSHAYVAKYNSCGDLVWTSYVDGEPSEGYGIAVDESNGVVYICGTYTGNIWMEDAQGPNNLCTAGNNYALVSGGGSTHGFVAQLDKISGCLNFLGDVDHLTNDYVDLRTMEINNNTGEIYVGGRYASSSSSLNMSSVIALKYAPTFGSGGSLGNVVWSLLPAFSGPTQRMNDIDYDETNDLLWMTGNYNPRIQFPSLPPLTALNSSPNSTPDAFLAVYRDNGLSTTGIDARKGFAPAGGGMTGEGIAVDDTDGDVYWTGTYVGNVPTPFGFSAALPASSGQNSYMMGLDISTANAWAESGNVPANGEVKGADVDINDGQVFFTGDFRGGDLELSGIGTFPYIGFPSADFWHIYTASYQEDGTGIWGNVTKDLGIEKVEHNAKGLNADSDGHIFVAGEYLNYLDYWLGSPMSGPLAATSSAVTNSNINAFVLRAEKSPAGEFKIGTIDQGDPKDQVSTELNENSSNLGLKTYPNPTTGMLNIKIDNYDTSIEGYLSVVNVLGEIVVRVKVTKDSYAIDLSDYKSGVYSVILRIGNEIKISRVIKS